MDATSVFTGFVAAVVGVPLVCVVFGWFVSRASEDQISRLNWRIRALEDRINDNAAGSDDT